MTLGVGREARLLLDNKHWAMLSRRWKSGDQITLRFPMRLRASPLDPQYPTPAAVSFGPVVLAFEAPTAQALQRVDVAALDRLFDGKAGGVADQFGPGRDLPFDWTHRGLSAGRHTIRLRLLPDKVEQSKDRYLNVIGFEVLNEK